MEYYMWEKDRERKYHERMKKLFILTGMMYWNKKVVPDYEILKWMN